MAYDKNDVIKNFMNLTGKSFEDSSRLLNNSNTFSDYSTNINIKEFHRVASISGASSGNIINTLSSSTGRSIENIRSEINMIPLTNLKK